MTTIQKVGVVVAGLLALLGGLSFFGFHLGGGSASFGAAPTSGQVQVTPMLFVNGFSAGSSQQLYADGSGNLFTSGLMSLSGGSLYSNTSATTTAGSETIKASDVNGYDTVILTPTVASATITFPASSTLATCLPAAGNTQKTCFVNGTTTAGVILTFAGGTGTSVQVASSSATALGALTLYPQKVGCFTFIRGNATPTTFDILGAYTAFN